jgi:hypothetical protein
MLEDGYAGLGCAETKQLDIEGSPIVVQHNSKRIRSTAAAVDQTSIRARKCFLCEDALPPEEKGLAYGDLLLMCNPFPILDRHLSIVHREHIEQKIAGNIELLLDLAADLSPDYFVLYNGPQCGASAPDHLHFQACSRELLPIERTARAGDAEPHCSVCEATATTGFEVFTVTDAGRSLIVFRGSNSGELAGWIYAALEELAGDDRSVEPMVNIISTYDRGSWTVYLFPRARHRPACYFAEGDDRLTVSPGAIDMAGVVVTPERDHFDRIGPDHVLAIFSEVSRTEEDVNSVVERVCQSMGAEESG